MKVKVRKRVAGILMAAVFCTCMTQMQNVVNVQGNTNVAVRSVALGHRHSAAITEEGDLYCWGDNYAGKLGDETDGTTEYQNIPVKIMSNVKSVSLGGEHSAAITEEGDLYCWGYNLYGEVGLGTGKIVISTPVKIMSNVKSVALGSVHSAAITEEGDLYCWGRNNYGQLGDGTTKEQYIIPEKVMSNVKSVALGTYYSAAITEEGDLYCWGENYHGELGDGTTEVKNIPEKIMSNVKSVALGDHHSAAITEEGDLYCWGENYYGELGDGTTEKKNIPEKIMSNVKTVSLGYYHSAVITEEGDLYCWGCNRDGQLGDGTTEDKNTPEKIMSNVKSVSLGGSLYEYRGGSHSAAITENGDLYCWGYNIDGQVGNGTTETQLTPVKVLVGRADNDTPSTETPDSGTDTPSENMEWKLRCASACTVQAGHSTNLFVQAYADSLDELRNLTSNITWESDNNSIATVQGIGFILPTSSTKHSFENGDYETWIASGMVYVDGISEGSATITGTASDGSEVVTQVTVVPPENTSVGVGNEEGEGGSLILGEEQSGSAGSKVSEIFPGNWSLKHSVFPVEISKTEKGNGSYTIRGTVGIGKGNWLDDEATWGKYKKNVSDANKYTGKVDCLKNFKDTWEVKSVTAVSTDSFKLLPELSVMGYFENIYDKNGNLISSDGKLAADASWKGSISWQFVTPIGPLYLNLSGSGKLSGKLGPKYDYNAKSLDIVDGSLKLTPSVALEGGYGIDKVATIGAQGKFSAPITLIPATKGEWEASAGLHAKLVFFLDYTWELGSLRGEWWDTTKNKTKDLKNNNVLRLSEGKITEMDTSFAIETGEWYVESKPETEQGTLNTIKDTFRRFLLPLNTQSQNTVTVLQEGILPSSLPMQVQLGDKKVMVFQAYDSSRNTLNSTVLKYSVQEDGVWSEPQAVWDNGYADLYADMKVVDDQLVLVWQKEKTATTGDVDTDSEGVLKEISENSEICFSMFDEETDTFVNPVFVTDNNQYDMMPKICDNSDDIIISWVRNDEADLMQENGQNTIYTAKWNRSAFEEETPLVEASGTVDDYVLYQDEDGIQTIFTGQANDIIAVFDTYGQVVESLSGIMMKSSDGNISGLNYSNGRISCISNGTLYSYDVSTENVTTYHAGESAFGAQVQYCSNGEKSGYIWSNYDDETKKGSILASIATADGYSEPVALVEQENVIWRYLSPVLNSDGNWEVIANACNADTDIHSLMYVTKKEETKLKLVGASIDENDVKDGLTGVDYFVANTGDTTIHNIEIEITLDNGETVHVLVPVTILPGESKAETAYVELPQMDKIQDVSLSITAENQTDKSDCTVTDRVGLSDIVLTAESQEATDEVMITATLKNQSSAGAKAILHLYENEEKNTELEKSEKITIGANGSTQVQFTMKKKDITYNENQAAYLTLEAIVEDGDYNEDNNTAYVILYKSDETLDNTPDDNPDSSQNNTTDGTLDNKNQNQVGTQVTIKKMKYKITKVNADGTGEVTLTGSSRKKNDKKFTSVKIGNTVKIKGKSFKITAVGAGAFSGYKRIKTVALGKNIKTIGKKAFYNCKKLKKLTIQSTKLKSIGKGSIKGISKKAVIKVPKSKVKSYKKLLKSKVGYKKSMKIKK